MFSKCPTAPCEVILFADVDGNFRYDGVSEQIQAVNLGSNVTIESISTGDTVNVMFKPPRPFICFDNNCSGVGDLTITLGSTKVTKTINVTINQVTGQISS